MKGEKVQALNYAIADMLPHLEEWEQDQEQAQVFIRAIAFATEPWWHIEQPVPVSGIRRKPLQVADSTEDIADLLVAASLAVSPMSESGADQGAVARNLFGLPPAIFNQDTII